MGFWAPGGFTFTSSGCFGMLKYQVVAQAGNCVPCPPSRCAVASVPGRPFLSLESWKLPVLVPAAVWGCQLLQGGQGELSDPRHSRHPWADHGATVQGFSGHLSIILIPPKFAQASYLTPAFATFG